MVWVWLWRTFLCPLGFHGVPEEVIEYHAARTHLTAWCPHCERLIK